MLYICEKLMRNNPRLDLVNVNAYAKFAQIPSIPSPDIERKRNSDDNRGPLLCCKFAKIDHNNTKLDLVKVSAYAKFDQIPSILSHDIERKRNSDSNKGP